MGLCACDNVSSSQYISSSYLYLFLSALDVLPFSVHPRFLLLLCRLLLLLLVFRCEKYLIEFCLRSTCDPQTAPHTNDSNCQLILLCFLCNGIAIILNGSMLLGARIESFQMRGLNIVNKQIVVFIPFSFLFVYILLFCFSRAAQQISRVNLFSLITMTLAPNLFFSFT